MTTDHAKGKVHGVNSPDDKKKDAKEGDRTKGGDDKAAKEQHSVKDDKKK